MADDSTEISTLLRAAGTGDRHAARALLPLVYDQLREVARAKMAREPAGHTLQPTALVHEAFARIVRGDDPGWDNSRHFFAAAAEAMRRILVERARAKAQLKRGAGRQRVPLDNVVIETPDSELLDLHAAIEQLEQIDERKGKLAVMRIFAGLSEAEAAKSLDVSLSTVERDWRFVKAWLRQLLSTGESER